MSYQRRPGGGTVSVSTNCFEITRTPNKTYFLYDKIKPEVNILRKREQIIHKLLTIVDPLAFSSKAIYDGNKLLYTSQEVQLGGGGGQMYAVSLRGDNNTEAGRAGVFSVKITRTVGEPLKPEDFRQLIGKAAGSPKMAAAVTLLQLLITSGAHQQHPHKKTSFFVDDGKQSLGGGLELRRGFYQAVRPTIKKLLVTVDTTMSPFYRGGAFIDAALDVLGTSNMRALQLNEGDSAFNVLEIFFNKLQITPTYMPNKTRIIRGLVSRAGQFLFDKNGQEMSVETYVKNVYNIQLKFPALIGIVVSKKDEPNRTVIPAELVHIKPGQIYKKKLASQMTAQAVKFSSLPPHLRLKEITTNRMSPVKTFSSSIANEAIYESGMKIDSSPLSITGNNPGSWNVMRQKFLLPAQLKDWVVVNFTSFRLDRFLPTLERCLSDLGMSVVSPRVQAANGHADISKELQNVLPTNTQLVVFILPTEAEHIRNRVKFWGDCEKGIMTQCLRLSKIERANNQYCNNVALKINARLGGVNFRAASPALASIQSQPFIIFGADVSHAGPNSLKPSVASIVWSMDDRAVKYAALTRIQHPRAEMIHDLSEMVAIAVGAFGDTFRRAPKHIVFYRDGVSEGEFAKVSQFEIPAIEEGIKKAYETAKAQAALPQLTFIVVGKKHHLSFYPSANDQAINDGKGNCRPGFVTSEGELENCNAKDFYLQSHAAIQGTSRSAHYIVLRDDIFNFDLPKLQDLSYSLCFNYAKATRSVSIPAPVYYADLACARGAFHFPSGTGDWSETASNASNKTWSDDDMERFKAAFHSSRLRGMYFL